MNIKLNKNLKIGYFYTKPLTRSSFGRTNGPYENCTKKLAQTTILDRLSKTEEL